MVERGVVGQHIYQASMFSPLGVASCSLLFMSLYGYDSEATHHGRSL